MRFTTQLLPSRSGNLGIVTLNHPKALHALTSDMIYCLQDILPQWGESASLKAILFKSSEAKRPAFCAGGDVKAVYDNGKAGMNAADFFWQEYQVNHAIATAKIPIVSFWDGVVMGGGVGITIHGKYRVATENTLFAMPETAIGLFPDVGSMWWMPRLLSKPVANYLALSGKRIEAADLLHTGLATHFVPAKELPDLESALIDATSKADGNDDVVASVLMSFHKTIPTSDCFLAKNKKEIQNTFGKDSVEDVMDALKQENSAFGRMTLESLAKFSPTSMKLSMEGLKRGAECQTIGEALQMEYRMAKACVRPGSDFYEGVRAVLVDKDHAPKWNPSTVEDVTPEIINSFFEPIDNEWPIPRPKL